MTHKFKVGDKVRVTELFCADRNKGVQIDDVFTVSRTEIVCGECAYTVTPSALFMWERQIELVPEFKVGDVVYQVEESVFDEHNYPDGVPLTIKKSTSFGSISFEEDDILGKAGGNIPSRFEHWALKPQEQPMQAFSPTAEIETDAPVDTGMKFDDNKIRMSLLTRTLAKPLFLVGVVLTYGAKKYLPNNWQGVSTERYEDALDRHLTAMRVGEERDEESGIYHEAHAICCLMFILWKRVKDIPLKELAKFNEPPEKK